MREKNKKIFPLGNRIVLKPEKEEEKEKKTSSGFIVSTKTKENNFPKLGIVQEIGPDVKNVSVGDTVVFKEFIPTTFEIGEEKFLILNEEDILAKIV